jgi:hypothetical protein
MPRCMYVCEGVCVCEWMGMCSDVFCVVRCGHLSDLEGFVTDGLELDSDGASPEV